MADQSGSTGEFEMPLEVSHALSLLVAAARVDSVLLDAAHKVDRYVLDLFGHNVGLRMDIVSALDDIQSGKQYDAEATLERALSGSQEARNE